jgi:peptidoglycan/xylan/chitin deacetylase (PgdA/CDA1 family)
MKNLRPLRNLSVLSSSLLIFLMSCKDSATESTPNISSLITSSSSVVFSSSAQISSSLLASSSAIESSNNLLDHDSLKFYTLPTQYALPTAVTLTSIDSSTWTASAPAKFAKWANFKRAAYSFTFDDGYASQLEFVVPILDKYGFKASFYMITSHDWSDFEPLFSQGHEIGSHSITHSDLTKVTPEELANELDSSLISIHNKLPQSGLLTFAYPYVSTNATVSLEAGKRYLASRGNGKITDLNSFKGSGIGISNRDVSLRTLAGDLTKIDQLTSYLSKTIIELNSWHVSLSHEVTPFDNLPTSWEPVATEAFDKLCLWLKGQQDQGYMWVAPVGQVVRYSHEVQRAKMGIVSQSPTQMILKLEDGLPDADFNVPLSFEIQVPATWKNVSISQNGKTRNLAAKSGYLIGSALPNNSEITIQAQ